MTQIANTAIKGTACIITGGLLDTVHAKTAHGLLRESKRFDIKGVIDAKFAGHDAGDYLEGKKLGISIFPSVQALMDQTGEKPQYAVIGMATKGGVLPPSLYPVILEALNLGLNIVNGLHQPLSEVEELKTAAAKNNVFIYDIRKPKPFDQLHFWKGSIQEVKCLKIGVLGTDCSIGKRTTAKFLTKALNEAGIKTEMIYTGQTGWLQGTQYGLIFDATPNDFIPGEIEHAVYECWKNEQPQVIIVEGQASLLNPGGPCGSEFIVSAKLNGVILQHHPIREKYNNLESLPDLIPEPTRDMQIIRLLGSDVWAITQNTAGMNSEEIATAAEKLQEQTGLPVVSPIEDGVGALVELIKEKLNSRS